LHSSAALTLQPAPRMSSKPQRKKQRIAILQGVLQRQQQRRSRRASPRAASAVSAAIAPQDDSKAEAGSDCSADSEHSASTCSSDAEIENLEDSNGHDPSAAPAQSAKQRSNGHGPPAALVESATLLSTGQKRCTKERRGARDDV